MGKAQSTLFYFLYTLHRPTLVLLDDLLKDDTAKSETKREQVKSTFRDVVIPIGTKDTNILVVGTILNEEDLMADLLKGRIPGVRSIKKSAIISWSARDDLFREAIEKIKIYSPEKIGFEVNQAQSYMKQKFEEELWQNKIYTSVDEVNSRGNKHERIISLGTLGTHLFVSYKIKNLCFFLQQKRPSLVFHLCHLVEI